MSEPASYGGSDDFEVDNVDVVRNIQEPSLDDGAVSPPESIVFDLSSVIAICNPLCRVDANAYCEMERTIEVGGVDVVGTCRAFSRKDNVDGFDKCEGFCKSFDKSGAKCSVDGEVDSDCDGVV